jgi:alkylation response protein AidB-like acyl-CoA dehydrogenase
MDFAFSEEQQMLRSQARSYLAEKLPFERVAELAQSEPGWDPATWPAMAELGWTSLSVSRELGGAGMGFIEEAVVFEELGYALYPGPYFATVALALPALEQAPEHLAPIVTGDSSATLAWAEPAAVSLVERAALSTKAVRVNGSWLLSGEKNLVADLGIAGNVVVVAEAIDGVGLWLLEPDGPVERQILSTMDTTRRLGTLRMSSTPATLLVEPGRCGPVLERIRLRAHASLALEAVGVAQRALELATEHAGSREQFDRPIGTFQAVSHKIADAYVATELARSLSYWAAWCVATGDEQARVAAVAAKARAAEGAVEACEKAIQVHGGIGFTWEHILHRFYKRAQWIESFEGFCSQQRAEIAAHLLDR